MRLCQPGEPGCVRSGTRGDDTEETRFPRPRGPRGEVDRELVRDGGVLDVGDALRREKRRQDVAILSGLRRGKWREPPDRQAEVEADPVEVAGADSCARKYEQTVFGQELPDLVHDGQDGIPAPIHDGAASDLHDLQPGEKPDRATASDGAGEVAVKEGLARERRGDVLDAVGGFGHGSDPLARGDDGADMLAGERAGQVARDEAIHNLHMAEGACRLDEVEHRELKDRVRAAPAPSSRQPRSLG